jgi:hypothetical protein
MNAIETLRKVAAAHFEDPAEVDPSIASGVAGVIRKALSPYLNARYQDADEMLRDLNAVVRDAGLGPTNEELPRFFKDPEAYEMEVAPRIAREMLARGKAFLASGDETRALDCFGRARALGLADSRTVDLVKVLSKRRERMRLKKKLAVGAAAMVSLAVIGGALVAKDNIFYTPDAARAAEASKKAPKPPVLAEAQPKLSEPQLKLEAVKPETPKPEPATPEPASLEAPPKPEAPIVKLEAPKPKREPIKRATVVAKSEPPIAAAAVPAAPPSPARGDV